MTNEQAKEPVRDPDREAGAAREQDFYSIAVTGVCRPCGKQVGSRSPEAVRAALRGEVIAIGCPSCGKAPARTPERVEEQMIKPARALPNRQQRRALERQIAKMKR